MNDSEFDTFLRSVGDEEPLPAAFKSKVWQRIETDSTDSFDLRSILERAAYALSQPLAATAIVVVMTLLGLGLGATKVPDSENMKTAYVQSVSPFKGGHR